MATLPEPHSQKIACPYCGDAPMSHYLFFLGSLFSVVFDGHVLRVSKFAPTFLRDFADWTLKLSFSIFLLLKLATLSSDIDKTVTFRSRVIWEEARRRGIEMQQLILLGKPTDHYRAKKNGKTLYFNSLPIPQRLINSKKSWDDKFVLKNEFTKANIPVPQYIQFSIFRPRNIAALFRVLRKPLIVKPRVGSRGRHTVTNIHTVEEFKSAIKIAKKLCPYLMAEEHLNGDVCRATFVNDELMGFYRASVPYVIGDGKKTVRELIDEKDKVRPERVEKIVITEEVESQIKRAGYGMNSALPPSVRLPLSHRTGRFFGGATKEMLDELHPSFIPVLKRAAEIVQLPVIGFDCIIPDPTRDANTQRWGIIECNTLPFIDLHYYALEGKPKNIAGAVWDLWQ